MEATTKKRRWWQFGLQGVLVLTLVVAAFFAGYSRRIAEVQELRQMLENERIKYGDLESERNDIAKMRAEWERRYHRVSYEYFTLQKSLGNDSPSPDKP